MAEEFVDIYDDNMALIGSKPRRAAHLEGDWHKAFHCWIVGKHGDFEYVDVQLRAPDKELYPNALDITAAGHYLQGEGIRDGLRELEEELGISTSFENLIPLGVRYEAVKVGNTLNREFDDVYLLRHDAPLAAYKLQPEEVSGLARISVHDGLRLCSGEVQSVIAETVSLEAGELIQRPKPIAMSDFIPRKDPYYMKVFIMSSLYFQGSKYLAI